MFNSPPLWVAKGYTQMEGRDYDDKYAPVIRSDTSRILLAVAATLGWHMRQFDVTTAFLNGTMDRQLYTTQPKGFEQGKGRVCLLNTALYGLVQSAHLWFEDLKAKLLAHGLKQSKHDDALFYDSGKSLYVTTYSTTSRSFAPPLRRWRH